MSNPGVVYLNSKYLQNGTNFRVEDNIGEAIHIHYGDEIRCDLSVENFLEIDDKASEWIEALLKQTGFKMKYFDSVFLDMISQYLIDLTEVKLEKIMLSDLRVETKTKIGGVSVVRPLKKSRIVKFLEGNKAELQAYKQDNLKGVNNETRVLSMYETIKENGYPFENKLIVLFNNQNIIRDGQHRAGCLWYEKGDMEIEIVRMFFKDNKYNASYHPWIHKFFMWTPGRIIRKSKSLYKRIRRRICDLGYKLNLGFYMAK